MARHNPTRPSMRQIGGKLIMIQGRLLYHLYSMKLTFFPLCFCLIWCMSCSQETTDSKNKRTSQSLQKEAKQKRSPKVTRRATFPAKEHPVELEDAMRKTIPE